MSDNISQHNKSIIEKTEHVDRCLSMVLHHKEVHQIASVIKKILSEKSVNQSEKDENSEQ